MASRTNSGPLCSALTSHLPGNTVGKEVPEFRTHFPGRIRDVPFLRFGQWHFFRGRYSFRPSPWRDPLSRNDGLSVAQSAVFFRSRLCNRNREAAPLFQSIGSTIVRMFSRTRYPWTASFERAQILHDHPLLTASQVVVEDDFSGFDILDMHGAF
jgi:hypothetical protein